MWTGSNESWVKGCDKALKLMEKELEKAINKNNENKGKKLDKFRQMMEDYQTEDEVNDAYGYNYITEKQKNELITAIRDGEEKATALDELDAYIYLLRTFIVDLNKEKECFQPKKEPDLSGLSDFLKASINKLKEAE